MSSVQKNSKPRVSAGFTLFEVVIVVGIVAVLSLIALTAFDQARKQARDKAQQSALKQLQLELRLYSEAHGHYPIVKNGGPCFAASPSSHNLSTKTGCSKTYIDKDELTEKLVPTFTLAVPSHNDSRASGCAYRYFSNITGSAYKLLAQNCVEADTVEVGHEFARCPASEPQTNLCDPSANNYNKSYAIYSVGAEAW